MVKAIPMEDWLRGCVYHDGGHREVMLPTDKVLEIANYIQRTRRSTTDGLIDLNDYLEAKCLNCDSAKACKENHWEGCKYEPKYERDNNEID